MSGKIRVCDIEKYYGNKNNLTKAVNRISFQVQTGEFVGIMGASGSGKTTLLNLLAAIDQVTAGHIYYGDMDITELPDKKLADFRKDHLGFVFQDFNLLDTLTLKENIVLAMALHTNSRKKIEERVSAVMKRLGIYELRNRFPYELRGTEAEMRLRQSSDQSSGSDTGRRAYRGFGFQICTDASGNLYCHER